MKGLVVVAWAICMAGVLPTLAVAESVNLAPRYQPHQQADSERLQNFRTPPPPPTNYPNISGGDRGDPRLNVNRDVSLGGSISPSGVEGNVRFPIPGQR